MTTDTDTREYEELVQHHRQRMNANLFDWQNIRDPRHGARSVQRKKHWWSSPQTVTEWDTLKVTTTMRNAYTGLCRARHSLNTVSLPADSPLHTQVEAALTRFLDLADTVALRYGNHEFATTASGSLEHEWAVTLASQIAALVSLAEQRESLLHNVDPESLSRTAAALTADLAAARAHLAQATPLDSITTPHSTGRALPTAALA